MVNILEWSMDNEQDSEEKSIRGVLQEKKSPAGRLLLLTVSLLTGHLSIVAWKNDIRY